MSISKSVFGTIKDGEAVELYTITNAAGASVSLMTLGGGIQSLNIPDKNGMLGDVVLGFDKPEYYLKIRVSGRSTAADASALTYGMLRKPLTIR